MIDSAKIEAVLFDLDGTLIDSVEHIVACWQHTVLTCLGWEITREQVLPTVGRALVEAFEDLAPGRSAELRQVYRAYQKQSHDSMVTLATGAREALEALKALGLRLGVVTSKGIEVALEGLNLFDLAPYFEVLVTFEDSERHKPFPEPLLVASERLGLSPNRLLYVGDAVFDLEAAKAAGMPCVAATWGAGTRDNLLAAGPVAIIDSFDELPPLLRLVASA